MRKIKKYQSPSGSLPNPNIFQRPDGSYFYSNDGKTEVNVTPLNKLTDNPAEWSYTDKTGRVYTPKKEYKNTYTLTESNPTADYHNYLNLKDKSSRDKTMAKAYLNNGNVYDAFMAYIGMKAPKNPFEITGEPSILPGRGVNSKTVQNVTKGMRTLEDYLRTTKVSAPKLEGTGYLRDNYATDRFLGGQIFESSLPEEAMRVQGHGMAKSPTIQDALARLRYMLDNGFEKGKTFYTAPLKLSEEGKKFGAYLGTTGGTPYFDGHFLITGKPGQMINSIDDISTIYVNDAYQNEEALKAAQKLQQYLQKTYPKINFKLYSQGYKQGGKMNTLQFLKNGSGIHIKKKNRGKFTDYCGGQVTQECINKGKHSSNPAVRKRATFADNARHFKHRLGGSVVEAFKLRRQILNSLNNMIND